MHLMRKTFGLTIGLALMLATPVDADPAKGEFSVHDLSLWIVDGAAPLVNARTGFVSPFPATIAWGTLNCFNFFASSSQTFLMLMG